MNVSISEHWVRATTPHPMMDTTLTKRELDVARLWADGMDKRDIAAALDISPNTVGVHLVRVYLKLDTHSRSAFMEAFSRIEPKANA